MNNQGVWDKCVHTAIFKMSNQQGPTGTLLNVLWQSEWQGSLGENGYKYMPESLCCLPKLSQHCFLIKYIPIQEEKLKKKKDPIRNACWSGVETIDAFEKN